MNVSYKREMRHNFLIMEAMEDEESFETRMLTGNFIEGLLKFRMKQEEQKSYYYYEITSKQPLSRLLEFKEIEQEELCTLIMEISAVLKRIEDYLLSESNLLLEPEHIYIEPESYQVWLCYIPGYKKSFPNAMEKLLQYLLKKTNHKNNDTVVLAYRLYQESQKDYYGIEDLLRIVRESQQGILKENTEQYKTKKTEEELREIEVFHEEIQESQSSKWKDEEENGDEGKKPKKGNIEKLSWTTGIKRVGIFIGILFSGPVFVWLYAGAAGLRKYQIGLLFIDSIAMLGVLVYWWKKKQNYSGQDEENRTGKREEWQMTFEEEFDEKETEEKENTTESRNMEGKLWESRGRQEVREQESENTVLLAEVSVESEHIHLLKSVNPSISDISVPYFPFIIGKQEGIVDYVLKKDTISRIHLRIDEEDGRCKVTDLNSSNGTAVGNYRLEANESCSLSSGDKLIIADISFIFY